MLDIQTTVTENDSSSVSLTFKCFAILTGILGVVTNGIVLAAMLSKNHTTQTVNIFIINQVILDFYSSATLAISFVVKLFPLYFDGSLGLFVCAVFDSNMIIYIGITGSIISLVLIAAERYFLIVHPVLHKTQVRRWLILALTTLPWIEGVATNLPGFWTSRVLDGFCFQFYFWPSETSQLTYSICIILLTFFIPLALLVFFYVSVLLVVRQRSQVFQGHYANQDMSTVLQTNAHRAQMNILSTMVIISVAFVVCWLPSQIYYFLFIIQYYFQGSDMLHNFTFFLVFLNICVNPFIYAAKLDPVKKKLRGWAPKTTTVTDMTTIT